MRSNQQNKLYHELCGQLYRMPCVKIWDGRFAELGYSNPIVVRLSAFNYDSAMELLKALDMEYKRDEQGKPLSSAKLTTEEMQSHLFFIQCLLDN